MSNALEGILTGEQAHVGVDLLQRRGQVDIDVFCGITVGDIAGLDYAALPEAGIPVHMEVRAVLLQRSGMQVHIHAVAVKNQTYLAFSGIL